MQEEGWADCHTDGLCGKSGSAGGTRKLEGREGVLEERGRTARRIGECGKGEMKALGYMVVKS